MLKKCVLTILELNWNQGLGHKKTKLNICHPLLTSSTQLQNRLFHVVERTRTSSKCQKMKNARAKRAKILFFIVKYANLWGFCCRRRRGCLSSLFSVPGTMCTEVFFFLSKGEISFKSDFEIYPSFQSKRKTFQLTWIVHPRLDHIVQSKTIFSCFVPQICVYLLSKCFCHVVVVC